MRQKYVISRDGPSNKLTIQEFAVTETKIKKPAATTLQNERYTFLCQETYENRAIKDSMAVGTKALISILRTRNIYPIEPYAAKIAETVIDLYNSQDYEPIELFFNDVDLVSAEVEAL